MLKDESYYNKLMSYTIPFEKICYNYHDIFRMEYEFNDISTTEV